MVQALGRYYQEEMVMRLFIIKVTHTPHQHTLGKKLHGLRLILE
jgi:hypothetical protein